MDSDGSSILMMERNKYRYKFPSRCLTGLTFNDCVDQQNVGSWNCRMHSASRQSKYLTRLTQLADLHTCSSNYMTYTFVCISIIAILLQPIVIANHAGMLHHKHTQHVYCCVVAYV